MANVQPYTISIPDSAIEDLKTRLSLAKFPDELDEAEWDLGAPLADVKRLTAYWKDKHDWRAAEKKLNELPQFTTSITIDGFAPLQIHFLHQKSSRANAIPLLFVHGWPGSFLEATKIINPLSNPSSPDQPAFHVVVISLPNFGFSEGVKRRGFAIEHYAETCNKLMLRLNYQQYVTQGGDWGFYITRAISLLYPQHCKATHLNSDFGSAPTWTKEPALALAHAVTPYTRREQAGLDRTTWFMNEGSGYRTQQSTKPQTLGYALTDSPVGLLSWIYEKLHDWTDDYAWTPDEICTWVGIYWFSTAGPAASLRIYYEAVHNNNDTTTTTTTNTKTSKITRERTGEYIAQTKIGFSHQPRDIRVLPNKWTRKMGNVVFERYNDSGGHFFAYEKPLNLLSDVREMFSRDGGGAYNVVGGGKTGYD